MRILVKASLRLIVLAGIFSSYAGERAGIQSIPFPAELKADYDRYPFEMAQSRPLRELSSLLQSRRPDARWAIKADGPAERNKAILASGKVYVAGSYCRPHYCDTHRIAFLIDPSSQQIWARLLEDDREEGGYWAVTWLGQPNDVTRAIIDTLENRP